MAELTPVELLEPHRFFFLPVREWKQNAPTTGRVELTRLPENTWRQDVLGDPGDTVVEYVGEQREQLPRPIVRHSPTGFEWGYGGSGPADLAANILALVLPLTEAWRLHQPFKSAFITRMAKEGGSIAIEDIRAWVDGIWKAELADAAGMKRETALRLDLQLASKYDELERRETAGETIPDEEWARVHVLEAEVNRAMGGVIEPQGGGP